MKLRYVALLLSVTLCLTYAADRADAKKGDAKKAAAKKEEPKPRTGLALVATPAESIHVPPGFKVELLYSVPKEQEGSWVNMCYDPKGRLIVSDQYGGLYRITPPAIGSTEKADS